MSKDKRVTAVSSWMTETVALKIVLGLARGNVLDERVAGEAESLERERVRQLAAIDRLEGRLALLESY